MNTEIQNTTVQNKTTQGTASQGTASQDATTLSNTEINKLDYIDEETLSRAILTFCLEGADAIMYTLLLGSQHAKEIVLSLKTMVRGFLAHNSAESAQQMQLPIVSEAAAQENVYDTNTSTSAKNKNQQMLTDMRNYIRKQPNTKTLEEYFSRGLKAWGYKNNNVPKSLELLHTTIAKWCIRLTHLPSWDQNILCDWFTAHGQQWIIAPHSEYWPKQLQDLSLHSHFSPPLCLWGIGNPEALTQCHNPLAIVGSRSCTDYGRELAYSFAKDCALKGHTVISGGAYGIDASAHWGAIDAQAEAEENQPVGKTIAVFAGGLSHMGPQGNAKLFEQIIENGGVCISELCPDTTPVGHRFLLRNRIIAALSSKVIVAQARLQSGALNTASWATELNRELYAIPGDITHPNNAGCNMLIHDSQAIMICAEQDINILFPQSHHYLANPPRNYSNVQEKINTKKKNNLAESINKKRNETTIAEKQSALNCSKTNDYNNIENLIIKAIAKCKKNHTRTNIDNIYEIIKTSYQKEESNTVPSIAEVSGTIALLELEGAILRNNEDFVIMQQKVA